MKKFALIGLGIVVIVVVYLLVSDKREDVVSPLSSDEVANETVIISEDGGNPEAFLKQEAENPMIVGDPAPYERDAKRLSDINVLPTVVMLYLNTDDSFFLCEPGKIYSSSKRSAAIDGTGWLPLDLRKTKGGSPLKELPVDPVNRNGFEFTYACDPATGKFEFNARLESYDLAGRWKDRFGKDKGNNPIQYEVGTDLTIIP